jgi:hypothetical protein
MNPTYLLENLWMPIVVAVVLAGLSAVVSKNVRDRFWKPIGRAVVWPRKLRITTATRNAMTDAELARLRREVQAQTEAVSEAQRAGQAELAASKALADERAREAKNQWGLEVTQAHRDSLRQGKAEGRAEVVAEVEAARAVPRLRPVWRIAALGGDQGFMLSNVQTDAVVSDVSIEAPANQLVFTSETQWRGLFNNRVHFNGRAVGFGKSHGVECVVRYRDELGDMKTGAAFLEREPLRSAGAAFLEREPLRSDSF